MANTLTILSHNIFWMQGFPFKSDKPPEPQPSILKELARFYEPIAPDVFCFQEIQSLSAFEFLKEAIGGHGFYFNEGAFAQYGGAVLVRNGLKVKKMPLTPLKPTRTVQVIQVSTVQNLTVCNIHLPYPRQLRVEEAAEKRRDEIMAVLNLPRRPDIICGDFNEFEGQVATTLRENDFLDTAILGGKNELGTTRTQKRGDQMWIHSSLTNHFVAYHVASEAQMQTTIEGKELLSDHFPIWITLNMNGWIPPE